MTYADGTVVPAGTAKGYGDARALALKAPILSGAATPAATATGSSDGTAAYSPTARRGSTEAPGASA